MMRRWFATPLLIVAVLVTLTACRTDSKEELFATSASQVELRSFQTRAFDTTDREKTLRTIIATLQDLSFVVDKADLDLGMVSATKLDGYLLRMTVTVRPRGEHQLLVRANANFQQQAVEEPGPYQQFFTALEKAMFLTAQDVE
jgi:hypothetical protein